MYNGWSKSWAKIKTTFFLGSFKQRQKKSNIYFLMPL
jgi:hypothetical protein